MGQSRYAGTISEEPCAFLERVALGVKGLKFGGNIPLLSKFEVFSVHQEEGGTMVSRTVVVVRCVRGVVNAVEEMEVPAGGWRTPRGRWSAFVRGGTGGSIRSGMRRPDDSADLEGRKRHALRTWKLYRRVQWRERLQAS